MVDPPAGGDLQQTQAVRDQLERGFRRLSVEHRAALVVHHYLALSDAEAATVLDVPIGSRQVPPAPRRRSDAGRA